MGRAGWCCAPRRRCVAGAVSSWGALSSSSVVLLSRHEGTGSSPQPGSAPISSLVSGPLQLGSAPDEPSYPAEDGSPPGSCRGEPRRSFCADSARRRHPWRGTRPPARGRVQKHWSRGAAGTSAHRGHSLGMLNCALQGRGRSLEKSPTGCGVVLRLLPASFVSGNTPGAGPSHRQGRAPPEVPQRRREGEPRLPCFGRDLLAPGSAPIGLQQLALF